MEALSVTQVIGQKVLVAVVEVDDARSEAELARCLGDSGIPIVVRHAGALTYRTAGTSARPDTPG
jgi:hypothetical protein